jgi:putative redox protein
MAGAEIMSVSVSTAAGGMRTEITTPSRGGEPGRTAVADVPAAQGGANDGPSPTQYLLASLAACKAMTARAYATRKDWPLHDIRVTVRHTSGDGDPRFEADVELVGDLDEAQRARVLQIMEQCHVQKMIAEQPRIVTHLVTPA